MEEGTAAEILAGVAGVVLIAVILWDVFEAMVLPRRVTRRLRPTRAFYRATWRSASFIARRMRPAARRETYLSFYGPLSLLLLFSAWAVSLVIAFALLHWALGLRLHLPSGAPDFAVALYMSGTTFFTLGLGDVTPTSTAARAVTVVEAGVGFGFLALVIGYLPVLYQGFSRREVTITLLDARAGSPPSAVELLRRHGRDLDELAQLLRDWERWSAELLESHLSYPVLSYFRSQHDNQSWLAALTTILDGCALVIAGIGGAPSRQAGLTFAMARHAVVDIAQVLGRRPVPPLHDRLSSAELRRLRSLLDAEGVHLDHEDPVEPSLAERRRMYEPYVYALSQHLLMPLPSLAVPSAIAENWRTSAWEPPPPQCAPRPADVQADDVQPDARRPETG